MTRVYAEQKGEKKRLSVQGHAEGSVGGCAYISGILYSLAGYLVNEGEILVDRQRIEPGDVELWFRGGEKAQAAYELAVTGLKQLEKSYPALIRVTEKRPE